MPYIYRLIRKSFHFSCGGHGINPLDLSGPIHPNSSTWWPINFPNNTLDIIIVSKHVNDGDRGVKYYANQHKYVVFINTLHFYDENSRIYNEIFSTLLSWDSSWFLGVEQSWWFLLLLLCSNIFILWMWNILISITMRLLYRKHGRVPDNEKPCWGCLGIKLREYSFFYLYIFRGRQHINANVVKFIAVYSHFRLRISSLFLLVSKIWWGQKNDVCILLLKCVWLLHKRKCQVICLALFFICCGISWFFLEFQTWWHFCC